MATTVNDENGDQQKVNDATKVAEEEENWVHKEKVYDEDAIKTSQIFKLNEESLKHPRLEENIFFVNLKNRITNFYLTNEKLKIEGPTPQMLETWHKTGFPWEYRVELHKQLKQLLLRCIACKNDKVQDAFVKQTYEWFFNKLLAMSALSQVEIDEEMKLLNPNVDSFQNAVRQVINIKARSALCDADQVREYNQELFEGEIPEYRVYAQRSRHPEIAPANVRIQSKKRKIFRNLDEKIQEVRCVDTELARKKLVTAEKQGDEHRRGLLTAQLGSIYEQRNQKGSVAKSPNTNKHAPSSVYA